MSPCSMIADRRLSRYPLYLMSPNLEQLHQRHRELAQKLAEIGPMLKGSVVERYMPCGKPNCRCQADPPQLHGPYWQWSTAVSGKTVSRRLDPEQVPLYLEWIENRKRLEAVLDEIFQLTYSTTERTPTTTARSAS